MEGTITSRSLTIPGPAVLFRQVVVLQHRSFLITGRWELPMADFVMATRMRIYYLPVFQPCFTLAELPGCGTTFATDYTGSYNRYQYSRSVKNNPGVVRSQVALYIATMRCRYCSGT